MYNFEELNKLSANKSNVDVMNALMNNSVASPQANVSILGDQSIWWKPSYDKNGMSVSRIRVMPQSYADLQAINDKSVTLPAFPNMFDLTQFTNVNRLTISYWNCFASKNESLGIKGGRFEAISPKTFGQPDEISDFVFKIYNTNFPKKSATKTYPDVAVRTKAQAWLSRNKSMSQFHILPVLILEDRAKPENKGKVKLWSIPVGRIDEETKASSSTYENWLFKTLLKATDRLGNKKETYDVMSPFEDSAQGKSCNIYIQLDGEKAVTEKGIEYYKAKFGSADTKLDVEVGTVLTDVKKYLGSKNAEETLNELRSNDYGMLHILDKSNFDGKYAEYLRFYNLTETGDIANNMSLTAPMQMSDNTTTSQAVVAPVVVSSGSDEDELRNALKEMGIEM
jgi:hypothetical protein